MNQMYQYHIILFYVLNVVISLLIYIVQFMEISLGLSRKKNTVNLCTTATLRTWKMCSLCRGLTEKDQRKVSFRLVVMTKIWLLLTGGCYLEVVIRTGLTVYIWIWFNSRDSYWNRLIAIDRSEFNELAIK